MRFKCLYESARLGWKLYRNKVVTPAGREMFDLRKRIARLEEDIQHRTREVQLLHDEGGDPGHHVCAHRG